MSALTDEDREVLELLWLPCPTIECPCDHWRAGLAAVMVQTGAGLDREQLLKLLLEVFGYLAHVTAAPIRGDQVVGVLGGAIADLAKADHHG